jgi:hypothetical protein
VAGSLKVVFEVAQGGESTEACVAAEEEKVAAIVFALGEIALLFHQRNGESVYLFASNLLFEFLNM